MSKRKTRKRNPSLGVIAKTSNSRKCSVNDAGHSHAQFGGIEMSLSKGYSLDDVFSHGLMFLEGAGGAQKDLDFGAVCILGAAEDGLGIAQAFLTACFLNGLYGFSKDLDIATGWYSRIISVHGEEAGKELVEFALSNVSS
jgi:hypothetical protein